MNLISKDQRFPNDLDGDGRRFYTDGPRAHEFLHEMNRDVFTPRNLMTVGEMSSTTLENCQRYAALDGSELSMTFNFHHLKVDYPGGEKWTLAKPDYVALKALFRHWQQGMHNVAWNALFWCNHDQPRIVSRFGRRRRTAGSGGEDAGDGAARYAGYALYLPGRRNWHDKPAFLPHHRLP